jgi:ribonuclease HII
MQQLYTIGVDECGTGALCGQLVVCGVRAPHDWSLPGLNDSKKLSEKKREEMRLKLLPLILNNTISFHLAERSHLIIDQLGMYAALKDAYVEIFHKLYQYSDLIITDGNLKFDNLGVDNYNIQSVIKADAKYPTVMAASILAKTYRDQELREVDKLHPQYDWKTNKGYSTKTHLQAIKQFGACSLHRQSYAPMKNMKEGIK